MGGIGPEVRTLSDNRSSNAAAYQIRNEMQLQ
jgi:hypothetical protein